MKTASSFYGEFGWEVMMWAPYLRGRSVQRVHCRSGHEGLYYDFAKAIVIEDKIPEGIPDGPHLLVNGKKLGQRMYGPPGRITPWQLPVTPNVSGCPRSATQVRFQHEKLRTRIPFLADRTLVIHARDSSVNPERNWPLDQWHALMDIMREEQFINEEAFDKVIAVGTVARSLKPIGTSDSRGDTVSGTSNTMCTRIVLGPSSGPMCLALLAPARRIITWSGNQKDASRYASEWNPFKVPVVLLPTWQPSPREVFTALASSFR